MRLVAHAELQVLPGAVVDLVVAVDFRPLFSVFDVNVLSAENPAEADRPAAGSRRRVVGVAQVEVGSGAEAVQLVAGTAAESGLSLRYILGGRLAVAPGVTDLAEEGECAAGIPSRVKIDEIGRRGFVRSRDLIVDAIERAIGFPRNSVEGRYTGEVRFGQRVVLHHITRIRSLARAEVDEVRRPQQVVAVVIAGDQPG